jgi:hypothetical protein
MDEDAGIVQRLEPLVARAQQRLEVEAVPIGTVQAAAVHANCFHHGGFSP